MLNGEIPSLAQARLRHHLELQSVIIEETVSRYCRQPLRVSGGDVGANRIWYEMSLDAPLSSPWAIEYDLQEKLGAAAQLSWREGRLRVAVDRPSPPVDLLTLMQLYRIPAAGALTAVLGLDAAGVPVQLNLTRSGHVLLAGGETSGAAALMQTTAVSLALANRPGQLQLLAVQLDAANSLSLLNALPAPFMLRPVITQPAAATAVLVALADRLLLPTVANSQAHILVLIDRVETLLATAGFAALAPLTRLLATTAVPLSLMIGTQQPRNDWLRYCQNRWGTRLVGRVADAAQAEAAMGLSRSRAEQLSGDGTFLLVRPGAGRPHYFQAAHADRYDLNFLLRRDKG